MSAEQVRPINAGAEYAPLVGLGEPMGARSEHDREYDQEWHSAHLLQPDVTRRYGSGGGRSRSRSRTARIPKRKPTRPEVDGGESRSAIQIRIPGLTPGEREYWERGRKDEARVLLRDAASEPGPSVPRSDPGGAPPLSICGLESDVRDYFSDRPGYARLLLATVARERARSFVEEYDRGLSRE